VGNQRNKEGNLFKTLIRAVLLYCCETWKITKEDKRELNSFQWQSLRRILRMKWQKTITNKRVGEIAEINNISCGVRRTTYEVRSKGEKVAKDHVEKNRREKRGTKQDG